MQCGGPKLSLCPKLSFFPPHSQPVHLCGFRCGYRQWKLKGWRFLGHLPDAVGSFRWICLLTTKPWALWLISPFSSTGTGESNIRLFWRSLQGFALLSVVSSPIANQFGGLPGRHSIHLYHFVSGSIQGHADILKRLKPVHVNWGLCLENYCLFSKADCCNKFYFDLWLMQGQQKDIFLCMYRFIEWCFSHSDLKPQCKAVVSGCYGFVRVVGWLLAPSKVHISKSLWCSCS